MQTYIRLFFNLLMPLTLLLSLLSIGYFTLDYDFSKAIKLGILAGVLLGISISLVMALLLLLLRKTQKEKTITYSQVDEIDEVATNPISSEKKKPKTSTPTSKELQCMLLLDKELTFDLILNALKKNKTYILAESNPKKGTLRFQTKEGDVQTSIKSLTKHTSRIVIKAQNNVKSVRNLIAQLKEREHSFLQY